MNLNEILGEPWRCVCPECQCYNIKKLVGGQRSNAKNFDSGRSGQLEAKESRGKKWLCRRCSKRLETVYDRKQEKKVAIDSLLVEA